MADRFFLLAAVNGLLVVAIGAFGAHGLEGLLPAGRLGTFETGVRYHMFHTLGLFAAALLLQRSPGVQAFVRSGYLFLTGIVLFSGSLYLLAITGIAALGMITPLGGVAFLAGWALMIAALLRAPGDRS